MENIIHGAKWWKFDFHNHTPKSNDFGKGDAAHMAITPENWLLMYMTAGIDCVAITDHNSGEWIDTLKAALTAMDNSDPKPIGYRRPSRCSWSRTPSTARAFPGPRTGPSPGPT